MNPLKTIATLIIAAVLFTNCTNQKTSNNNNNIVDVSTEIQAVSTVLKNYKDAIQDLNAEATLDLFTSDSQVFESGGSEGSYTNYLEHHLGPELHHFNSFIFSEL